MVVGDGQTVVLQHAAVDRIGNQVGTFSLTILVDFYTIAEVDNADDNLVLFTVDHVSAANHSLYSGLCWAISGAKQQAFSCCA